MNQEATELARLAEVLDALRQEVAGLSKRVATLEAGSGVKERVAGPAPVADGLSEELALVIGAAIAAYLGKKAPIRQIRLLGSVAWAQQGRATIQASHAL
jgi:methylmalonyl-CoA carboxyltransferase large subunit